MGVADIGPRERRFVFVCIFVISRFTKTLYIRLIVNRHVIQLSEFIWSQLFAFFRSERYWNSPVECTVTKIQTDSNSLITRK